MTAGAFYMDPATIARVLELAAIQKVEIERRRREVSRLMIRPVLSKAQTIEPNETERRS